jgi:hypothetical protein
MADNSSPVELRQRKFFRRTQSFSLVEDHQIACSVTSPTHAGSWQFPLHVLGTETSRSRHLELAPLVLIIPAGLMAFFVLIAAGVLMVRGDNGWIGTLVISAFFSLLTLGLVAGMLRKSYDSLIFPPVAGNQNLVLWFNNPNRSEFEGFVAKLKDAIRRSTEDRASGPDSPPRDLSLTGEIERLKDQFDRGVLTPEQFESGKNKLLGIDLPRKVGF